MQRAGMRLTISGVLLAVSLLPSDMAWGWGFPAHRRINRHAVELLPPPLGDYYRAHSSWLVALATDADQRRRYSPEEAPSHYIDFEYYGDGPYEALPQDRRAAEEQFGRENLPKWGTLPWHAAGLTEALRDAMAAGEWERVLVLSADLGHFIGDGHQPLHTTVNYDGKESGNDGVHSLFESVMVSHYMQRYQPDNPPLVPIDNLAVAIFGWLAESYDHLQALLDADSRARQGLTEEQRQALREAPFNVDVASLPEGYLDRLYAGAGQLAWDRMELAVVRLASLWQWAWVQAGSPDLPG